MKLARRKNKISFFIGDWHSDLRHRSGFEPPPSKSIGRGFIENRITGALLHGRIAHFAARGINRHNANTTAVSPRPNCPICSGQSSKNQTISPRTYNSRTFYSACESLMSKKTRSEKVTLFRRAVASLNHRMKVQALPTSGRRAYRMLKLLFGYATDHFSDTERKDSTSD